MPRDGEIGTTCLECGKPMVPAVGTYDYGECGVPVYLCEITIYRCEGCGEEVPLIPNILGLHFTIGLLLIQKETRLLPEEVRFLRKALQLSTTSFGRNLGVEKSSVSGWESGKTTLSLASDKNIRRTYLLTLLKGGDRNLVDVHEIIDAIEHVSKIETPKVATLEVSYFRGVAAFGGDEPMPPAWIAHAELQKMRAGRQDYC